MPVRGQDAAFQTTRWSVVVAAGRETSDVSRQALEVLCRHYWYPLYAYLRRRGFDADRCADLTQGFFARLLEQKMVRGADRGRGRFRSYLLGALKHFLSHERERAAAQKRGGGREPIPLDARDAEARYRIEPSHDLTAEKLFDRRWATTVLELALQEMERESVRAGKEAHFRRLKEFLAGGSGDVYREAGAELSLSEGAVRVLVHRMRRRYRELIRREVAQTVASAEQVEAEVRHLFDAVSA